MASARQRGGDHVLPTREDPRLGFGRSAPMRWRLTLMGGVFFTFAPVWLLSVSTFANSPSLLGLVVMGLLSGLTGVGYALSATITSRLLWIVIPVHAASIVLFNVMHPEWVGMSRPRASVEGLWSVLSIAAGYTLFVWYIAGEGSRSLRLRTELALARQIHDTLAPTVDHRDARLEVFGTSVPGSEMGGDLVDLVEGEGWTDVYVADVSGHGVRAGVVMAMVKSAIRALVTEGRELGRLLEDLNRVLTDLTPDQMFATFACLRAYDDGRLEVALAGHLPILVCRAGGETVEEIDNESLPLGVSETERYEARTVRLAGGDTLAIYTDGLIETMDASGEMFGVAGVSREFGASSARGPRASHGAVMDAVAAFGPQGDDRTMVVARVVDRGDPAERWAGSGV
jgi:hypothetical protein